MERRVRMTMITPHVFQSEILPHSPISVFFDAFFFPSTTCAKWMFTFLCMTQIWKYKMQIWLRLKKKKTRCINLLCAERVRAVYICACAVQREHCQSGWLGSISWAQSSKQTCWTSMRGHILPFKIRSIPYAPFLRTFKAWQFSRLGFWQTHHM